MSTLLNLPFVSSSSYEVQGGDEYPAEDINDVSFIENSLEKKSTYLKEGKDKLTGKVSRIFFPSAGEESSNGYAVIGVETFFSKMVKVSGTLAGYKVGDAVCLRVEQSEHPKYGMQYKALGLVSNEEQDPIEQLAVFLEGGFISHIGPARAKAIIERFGASFTEIVKKDPSALTVISGITISRSKEIAKSWLTYIEKWEIMGQMRKIGIPDSLLLQWSQMSNLDLRFEAIKQNPYLLTKERGIGFIKADAIAKKNGISEMANIRIESGFVYTLDQAFQNGHTCLSLSSLFEQTYVLLFPNNKTISTPILKKFEETFIQQGKKEIQLFKMKNRLNENGEKKIFVYSPSSYVDEEQISKKLSEKLLLHTKKNTYFIKCLEEWEKGCEGFVLHEQQRAALLMAATSPVSIITGGPGTGKTTILSLLVNLCDREKIACCAPTGRAAKRMGEVITSEWGTKPQTIHRLFGYNGSNDFNNADDSVLSTDFLIIDEVSMLDQALFARVLSSIETKTRLVLIGDSDQLPSVGAGNVLYDLISSGVVPITQLTKIYRQSEDSYIPRNAWAVSHGRQDIFTFEKGRDFSFTPLNLSQNLGQQVLQQVKEMEMLGLSQKEIMVLSPKKAGVLGVNALNTLLQNYFNPHGKVVPFPVFEDRLPFRLGDPVMQTKNDYIRGIFNGDIGYISKIDGKKIKINFDYDLELAQKSLSLIEWWTSIEVSSLIPAYASTVHKSQGGQAAGVVMVCDKASQFMTSRELLYTGMTRAQKYCSLIGDMVSVLHAIETSHGNTRCTGLKEELQLAVKTMKAENLSLSF